MKTGEGLKLLRKSLGLTQKEMVSGTKIRITHYSKMENGQNRIFISDLIDILNQHNIKLSYFFEKYIEDNKKSIKMNTLSEQLNIAFYQHNVSIAKEIKKKILADSNSTVELKDRSIQIVDSLENKSSKNNSKILKDFFKYQNWTQSNNALVLLGNSIRIDNLEDIYPLILELMRKYKDLSTLNLDKQRRLAIIGINYIFNFRNSNKTVTSKILKMLSWLKTTTSVPELGIIKEVIIYFDSLYNKDYVTAFTIKRTLEISGLMSISNNLPN